MLSNPNPMHTSRVSSQRDNDDDKMQHRLWQRHASKMHQAPPHDNREAHKIALIPHAAWRETCLENDVGTSCKSLHCLVDNTRISPATLNHAHAAHLRLCTAAHRRRSSTSPRAMLRQRLDLCCCPCLLPLLALRAVCVCSVVQPLLDLSLVPHACGQRSRKVCHRLPKKRSEPNCLAMSHLPERVRNLGLRCCRASALC